MSGVRKRSVPGQELKGKSVGTGDIDGRAGAMTIQAGTKCKWVQMVKKKKKKGPGQKNKIRDLDRTWKQSWEPISSFKRWVHRILFHYYSSVSRYMPCVCSHLLKYFRKRLIDTFWHGGGESLQNETPSCHAKMESWRWGWVHGGRGRRDGSQRGVIR